MKYKIRERFLDGNRYLSVKTEIKGKFYIIEPLEIPKIAKDDEKIILDISSKKNISKFRVSKDKFYKRIEEDKIEEMEMFLMEKRIEKRKTLGEPIVMNNDNDIIFTPPGGSY